MIHLNAIQIGRGDIITVQSNGAVLKAKVLNAGGGASLPEDDELFWFHAPAKGVGYPLDTEACTEEITSDFILVHIDMPTIPFTQLPQAVSVQKENSEINLHFIATAIIGMSNGLQGYLVYLQMSD